MANYNLQEIKEIIVSNPNKSVIEDAVTCSKKLRMHVLGKNMGDYLNQIDHFESIDIYNSRKKYAVSNVDLFGRILQQEEMVFTARGGSQHFNLSDSNEILMNTILDDVYHGMKLRDYIRKVVLEAYRVDPAGVIFIEKEALSVNKKGNLNKIIPYPTYKSTECIYDYSPKGRNLDYIVFQLSKADCEKFGVVDDSIKDIQLAHKTDYYRFVDDTQDTIIKKTGDTIVIPKLMSQPNPMKHSWSKTPAFVISDIMDYKDYKTFYSPIQNIVELAECYLTDRSVRDLQKKYHGYAKAIEPLLNCNTCQGTGFVDSKACPDCSTHGAEKGTGYKMHTKISDVARFPLDVFEKSGFDFQKIYGYASPDIKSWEKQDNSLSDLEALMKATYWGIALETKTSGPSTAQNNKETATKTYFNQRPIEAVLNLRATWAESTENLIAEFIGISLFGTGFKGSGINYGRDWQLKTSNELLDEYMTMRTKGVPDFVLDDAMDRYLRSLYQNSPIQLAKAKKMLDVEPFPHITTVQAKTVITNLEDYYCKLYFGEWANTISEYQWISPSVTTTELKQLLKDYVQAKDIKEPTPQPI